MSCARNQGWPYTLPARWSCGLLLWPLAGAAAGQDPAALATSPDWLALGHYHATWSGHYQGEADDPAFYLSPTGSTDPVAELEATLEGLRQAWDHGSMEAFACSYPARLHWIYQQKTLQPLLPPGHPAAPVCPELETWMADVQPQGVTLVFPGAYLDSASSMFGHSFLRIDRAIASSTAPLLATTINFTADAEQARRDNELFYAWKGLTGGYPGKFSILPYHTQVSTYNHMESRDIWEYALRLDASETRQLMRHVWEVRPIRFDYYFMDENCSYRTLALLDVARPSLDLRSSMPYWVLPVDAVRALSERGMVRQVSWRPSSSSTLQYHVEQLSEDEQDEAIALENGTQDCCDREHTRAIPGKVLEVAYEALRYHTIPLEPASRQRSSERALALLAARSRQQAGSGLAAPPQPAVAPEQGHPSRRISSGAGFQNGAAFGELEYRPLYHDLTDPAAGYQQGAAISFLDTSLRSYGHGEYQLEQLEALGISSLNAMNRFIHPSSWQFRLGARRISMDGGRPLLAYLEGDWGGAIAPARHHLLYGLASASLLGGGALPSWLNPGFGPRAGWLYQDLLGGQGMLDASYRCYLASPDQCLTSLRLEHTLNLPGGHQSLRFRAGRESGMGSEGNLVSLSFQHYF